MTKPRLLTARLDRNSGLALLFVLEIALISLLIPGYFSLSGLLFASQAFIEPGIVALGMTLVIVAGMIDISVGSLLGLVVVAVGFSFAAGLPMPLAMILGVLVGGAGGALNGFMITFFKLNSLVVTLGTLALFRGVALAISNAKAVSSFPDWFQFIGQGTLGPVPVQTVLFAALALIFAVLLRRTAFGRLVYAVGANETATRFSGRSPDRIRLVVFVLQGLLVGFAGIIYCARISSARGNEGVGLEFSAITMVVIGGSRITGGQGTVLGTVLGGLIIWYVQDGLSFAGVSSDWGLLITGVFLLVGVLLNENWGTIRNFIAALSGRGANPVNIDP